MTYNARLSGNDVLCRVLGRYTFVVDATDVGLAPHLIADGFWEIWITRLIAASISEGMVCLDAGANVGYYSVLMADLVGPTGRLIAAEPITSTRRLLARNIHHNGFANRTEVLDVALGETSGEVTLIMPRGEPKNAHIADVDESRILNGEFERFRAQVQPVDQLQLPRLDVAKIDVEGAEEAIWAGMQETLDRSPEIKIFMEVNPLRCSAPEAFIASVANRFPLRTIGPGGRPTLITTREVLVSREDIVLYLSKV